MPPRSLAFLRSTEPSHRQTRQLNGQLHTMALKTANDGSRSSVVIDPVMKMISSPANKAFDQVKFFHARGKSDLTAGMGRSCRMAETGPSRSGEVAAPVDECLVAYWRAFCMIQLMVVDGMLCQISTLPSMVSFSSIVDTSRVRANAVTSVGSAPSNLLSEMSCDKKLRNFPSVN